MWWVSHPGVEDAYEHADHEYREERIEGVGANGGERATQPSEQSHSKGDSLLYTYCTLLTGTGATCTCSTPHDPTLYDPDRAVYSLVSIRITYTHTTILLVQYTTP